MHAHSVMLAAEGSAWTSNSWVVAGGYFLAALVGLYGGLRGARQQPHDVLKTYVEILKDLPDGLSRDALQNQIEQKVAELTLPPKKRWWQRSAEAPITRELAGRTLDAALQVVLVVAAGAAIAFALGNANGDEGASGSAIQVAVLSAVAVAALVVGPVLIRRSTPKRDHSTAHLIYEEMNSSIQTTRDQLINRMRYIAELESEIAKLREQVVEERRESSDTATDSQ